MIRKALTIIILILAIKIQSQPTLIQPVVQNYYHEGESLIASFQETIGFIYQYVLNRSGFGKIICNNDEQIGTITNKLTGEDFRVRGHISIPVDKIESTKRVMLYYSRIHLTLIIEGTICHYLLGGYSEDCTFLNDILSTTTFSTMMNEIISNSASAMISYFRGIGYTVNYQDSPHHAILNDTYCLGDEYMKESRVSIQPMFKFWSNSNCTGESWVAEKPLGFCYVGVVTIIGQNSQLYYGESYKLTGNSTTLFFNLCNGYPCTDVLVTYKKDLVNNCAKMNFWYFHDLGIDFASVSVYNV